VLDALGQNTKRENLCFRHSLCLGGTVDQYTRQLRNFRNPAAVCLALHHQTEIHGTLLRKAIRLPQAHICRPTIEPSVQIIREAIDVAAWVIEWTPLASPHDFAEPDRGFAPNASTKNPARESAARTVAIDLAEDVFELGSADVEHRIAASKRKDSH
jgi:hypothetical protein